MHTLIENLLSVKNSIVISVSGEVSENSNGSFRQVHAIFADGSEFLVDGESCGNDDEHINGGRIAGEDESTDSEIVDLVIDFIREATDEEILSITV